MSKDTLDSYYSRKSEKSSILTQYEEESERKPGFSSFTTTRNNISELNTIPTSNVSYGTPTYHDISSEDQFETPESYLTINPSEETKTYSTAQSTSPNIPSTPSKSSVETQDYRTSKEDDIISIPELEIPLPAESKPNILISLIRKAPKIYDKISKSMLVRSFIAATSQPSIEYHQFKSSISSEGPEEAIPKVKGSSRDAIEREIKNHESEGSKENRSFQSFRNIIPDKNVACYLSKKQSILKLRKDPQKALSESVSFGEFRVGPHYREERPKPRIFWMTTEIARNLHKNVYLQEIAVKELSIFVIYLLVLVTITWNINVPERYQMQEGLSKHFENMDAHNVSLFVNMRKRTIFDVKSLNQVYEYINTTWISAGWTDHYHGVSESKCDKSSQVSWVILGTFRVRQLRNPYKSCNPGADFNGIECFTDYDASFQDKTTSPNKFTTRSFVVDLIAQARGKRTVVPGYNENLDSFEEYKAPDKYSEPEDTHVAWYPSGGYIANFRRGYHSRKRNMRLLQYMAEQHFIDRRTRAVFIEAVVYNPNVNLISEIKVLFEFYPTGEIKPRVFVRPVVIFALMGADSSFLMGCFYVLVVFTALYVLEEIREIFYFKKKYVLLFWTYVDWIIIFYVFKARVHDVYASYKLDEILDWHKNHLQEYMEIGRVIEQVFNYECCLAMATLFGFFKLLRYWLYFFNAEAFWMTVWDVSESMMVFIIHFTYFFLGFAILGCLLFGAYLPEFNSISSTIYTLIRFIMGYFDYNKLVRDNLNWGRIYYLVAYFFLMIPVLAFSLAMFYHWYGENARETIHRQGLSFKTMRNRLMRKFRGLLKLPRDSLTKREIRDALMALDFTEPEIDLFFHMHIVNARYTVDPFLAVCRIMEMKTGGVRYSDSGDRKVGFLATDQDSSKTFTMQQRTSSKPISVESSRIIEDDSFDTPNPTVRDRTPAAKSTNSEEDVTARIEWLRGLLDQQVTKLGTCSCTSLCSCIELERDIFANIKKAEGLDLAVDDIVSEILSPNEAELAVKQILAETLMNLESLIQEMVLSGLTLAEQLEASGSKTGGKREVERLVSQAIVDTIVDKISEKVQGQTMIPCTCASTPCTCVAGLVVPKKVKMVDKAIPCTCMGKPPCTCSTETPEMKALRTERLAQERAADRAQEPKLQAISSTEGSVRALQETSKAATPSQMQVPDKVLAEGAAIAGVAAETVKDAEGEVTPEVRELEKISKTEAIGEDSKAGIPSQTQVPPAKEDETDLDNADGDELIEDEKAEDGQGGEGRVTPEVKNIEEISKIEAIAETSKAAIPSQTQVPEESAAADVKGEELPEAEKDARVPPPTATAPAEVSSAATTSVPTVVTSKEGQKPTQPEVSTPPTTTASGEISPVAITSVADVATPKEDQSPENPLEAEVSPLPTTISAEISPAATDLVASVPTTSEGENPPDDNVPPAPTTTGSAEISPVATTSVAGYPTPKEGENPPDADTPPALTTTGAVAAPKEGENLSEAEVPLPPTTTTSAEVSPAVTTSVAAVTTPKEGEKSENPTVNYALIIQTPNIFNFRFQIRQSVESIVQYAIAKMDDKTLPKISEEAVPVRDSVKRVGFGPDQGLIEIQPSQAKVHAESELFSEVVKEPPEEFDNVLSDVGSEYFSENDPIKVKKKLSKMVDEVVSGSPDEESVKYVRSLLSEIVIRIQKQMGSFDSLEEEGSDNSDDIQRMIVADTLEQSGSRKLSDVDILAEKKIADIAGFNLSEPQAKRQLKAQALTRIQYEELQIKVDKLEVKIETAVEKVHQIIARLKPLRLQNRQIREQKLNEEQTRQAKAQEAAQLLRRKTEVLTSTDDEQFLEDYTKNIFMREYKKKHPEISLTQSVPTQDSITPVASLKKKRATLVVGEDDNKSTITATEYSRSEKMIKDPSKQSPVPSQMIPVVDRSLKSVSTRKVPAVDRELKPVTVATMYDAGRQFQGSDSSRGSRKHSDSSVSLISKVESKLKESTIGVIYEEGGSSDKQSWETLSLTADPQSSDTITGFESTQKKWRGSKK